MVHSSLTFGRSDRFHGLYQSIERGFTASRILEILRKGESTLYKAERGLQIHFELNGNKVIVDPLKGRINTVYGPGKGGAFVLK